MTALPPALAPWEESLGALDPAIAVDLGPLLHLLDELVGRLDDQNAEAGELDGYDGITTRGDPDRLLVSEWLLAEELPFEFLRRAAENELTYLRRAHRSAGRHGDVVAVCDGGPEQWGVGRLVQLAALVVLDRRARATGAGLVLVTLPDGSRHRGTLDQVLPHWLRSRSAAPTSPAALEAALAGCIEESDRVWLLAGRAIRSLAPRHRRSLSSWTVGWAARGAVRAGIRVGNATAEVDVPDPRNAIATLRGEGLWRPSAVPAAGTVDTTGRGAVFSATDSRLLWRGEYDDEVRSCFVDAHGNDTRPAVRRHKVPGAVLGAASMNRRLVLAVTDRDRVWIRVVGKSLAHTHRIDLPATSLGLDATTIGDVVRAPLRPLFLQGGQILMPVGPRWWVLDEHGAASSDAVLVAPGPALDNPRLVRRMMEGKLIHDRTVLRAAAGIVLGPPSGGGSWCASSDDSRLWRVAANGAQDDDIAVPEGERVLGLCLVGGVPTLVVVSSGGRLLRTVSKRHTRTWTRWSGPAHFDLHPTRPWIARTTPEGITVGDLASGATLLDLRVET